MLHVPLPWHLFCQNRSPAATGLMDGSGSVHYGGKRPNLSSACRMRTRRGSLRSNAASVALPIGVNGTIQLTLDFVPVGGALARTKESVWLSSTRDSKSADSSVVSCPSVLRSIRYCKRRSAFGGSLRSLTNSTQSRGAEGIDGHLYCLFWNLPDSTTTREL